MTKPTIDLSPSTDDLYLIYLCDSGVEYTTQSAGFACHHPTVEGVLVPLRDEFYDLLDLSRFCCQGLDPENTDTHAAINQAIAEAKFEYTFGYKMTVDALSLHNIEEAWIPVILERVGEPWLDTFENFPDRFQGILVYQNCD